MNDKMEDTVHVNNIHMLPKTFKTKPDTVLHSLEYDHRKLKGNIFSGVEFFLVVVKDRHTDNSHYLYADREKAIKRARKEANQNNHHSEDYKEEEVKGWEFYAQYSCEGDCVFVEKIQVEE